MFSKIRKLIQGQLVVAIAVACSVAQAASGSPEPLTGATKAYNHTDYKSAIDTLLAIPSQPPQVTLLLGKCYYMLGEFKKASETFQAIVDVDPGNSEYNLWLARAYGRRAESSSPLTAPSHAGKARQYFEKAVQLDPTNGEALDDLFDYYLQAPGFLGGGLDKAAQLLPKIKAVDSAEFHFAQAQISEKKTEFATAEQQFRRAMELAPRQVGRVIDLAKFLFRRGKVQEGDDLIKQAGIIAPNDPKVTFEKAKSLISTKRDLDEAKRLLRVYMNSHLTPDLPSRQEAEKLLRRAGGGA